MARPPARDPSADRSSWLYRHHARDARAFAVIALLLAAAGIFAVLSQLVSQRTREIGVRVALGASPRDVFQLIVSRGMILTLVGVAIGLAAAAAMSRLMSSLLFNVTPYDLAFAAVTIVLVGVALMGAGCRRGGP